MADAPLTAREAVRKASQALAVAWRTSTEVLRAVSIEDPPFMLLALVEHWRETIKDEALRRTVEPAWPIFAGVHERPFDLPEQGIFWQAEEWGCAAWGVVELATDLWSHVQSFFPRTAQIVLAVEAGMRAADPDAWDGALLELQIFVGHIFAGRQRAAAELRFLAPRAEKAIVSAKRLRWQRLFRHFAKQRAEWELPFLKPGYLWEINRALFVFDYLSPEGGRKPMADGEEPARLPGRREREREARDRWVYKRVLDPKATYKAILGELKRLSEKHGWPRVTSLQRIPQIAREYAEVHRLPLPPPRQNR
jgi:hypothetical protein